MKVGGGGGSTPDSKSSSNLQSIAQLDTIQMASELLDEMLTGQETLDGFLMVIKRRPLDDYDDQGGSRDVGDRPREGKTEPESPRKRTCAPSALEVCPTRSRSARVGQNNPLYSWDVPHVLYKCLSMCLMGFYILSFLNGSLLGPCDVIT
ncbi:hypothetical protein FXO37_33318 [Capsicum annuum]|nr:hypothetical protein FXO37_33318 [Capsicum annuum]